MARKKRQNPNQPPATPAAPTPSASSPAALDVWLQRLSHVSQLGLFVFTVGALYFTVIPLYQKALLDEQIARKEIELRNLQIALNAAYAKNRTSIVRNFVFSSGAACSGLLIPPPILRSFGEKSASHEKSLAEEILEIRPQECLAKELNAASQLKELRANDLALLRSNISAIGPTLEQSRQAALVRLSKAGETSRNAPRTIPTTGAAGAIAAYVLNGQSAAFQQQVLAEIAADKERLDAASQYGNEVRSRLRKLNTIQWPTADDHVSGL